MLRLDTSGCILDCVDCGQVQVVNEISNLVTTPEMQVKVYPNPAAEMVLVDVLTRNQNESPSFVVYDIVAREILRKNIMQDQMQVPRDGVASGIYTWQVQNGYGQNMAVGKLVWE